MKSMRRLISIAVAVCCILSFTLLPVCAADYCTKISGSFGKTTSFTVNTGSRFLLSDYVKLKATQGSLKYWTIGIPRTKSIYGRYYIKTYDYSTKKTTKEKWSEKETYKLKLKKNRKYKITIQPIPTYAWGDYNVKMQTTMVTKNPKWKVYKTKGVTACIY